MLQFYFDDGVKYGIIDGDEVSVKLWVGWLIIEVEIIDVIMFGVVFIFYGWGYNKKGIKLFVVSQYFGVNINIFIDDLQVDELLGNVVLNGVFVDLEKVS